MSAHRRTSQARMRILVMVSLVNTVPAASVSDKKGKHGIFRDNYPNFSIKPYVVASQ